jgi:Fe(3+) dicitrate transport protein
VPEVPLHTGSLTLGLEHASGWHISATLTHMDSFFTDPANTRDPILTDEDGERLGPDDVIDLREPIVLGAVPSRTLLSARASYAIPNTPVTLWVQGRNLTDKLYISDYSNGLRPGASRTVIGGVTIRF